MGEALKNFSFEAAKEKNDNNTSIENILKHLDDVNGFFLGDYVLMTRKQEFGFDKTEQFEALRRIKELKNRVGELSEKEIEIARDNHLDHILGNSITVTAGAFARKFEEGKYFNEGEENKPFPTETFEMIKEGMELMLYYVGELEKDENLVESEVGSRIGYLNNFVEYLLCDLPTQSVEQLKLFRFFRELKTGKISFEELNSLSENVRKYLNIDKISESWDIIVKN